MAQAGLHCCQEVAQPSGDAEQHASSALSASYSPAHMLGDEEALAEQGLLAVRHAEPGGGAVSSQNRWEEAGRQLLMNSTLADEFGSGQVRSTSELNDTQHVASGPTLGIGSEVRAVDGV